MRRWRNKSTHLITLLITSAFYSQNVPHLKEIKFSTAHKIGCWLGLRESNCLWSKEIPDPRHVRSTAAKFGIGTKSVLSLFV